MCRGASHSEQSPSPLKRQCLQPPSLTIPIPSFKTAAGGKENEPRRMEVDSSSGGAPPPPAAKQRKIWEFPGDHRGRKVTMCEFPPRAILRSIMAKKSGTMWEETKAQVEAMVKKVDQSTDGSYKATYQQINYSKYDKGSQFKGSYYIGRSFSRGTTQGMWRMVRNTLMRLHMLDIDMVNAHPSIAGQLFGHLDIPTYLDYARDRNEFFGTFAEFTGLGSAWCKKVVSSIMYGSPRYGITTLDWEEIWADPKSKPGLQANSIASLDDLTRRLDGIAFLKDLRKERDIIYQQIQEDYPAFWAMCREKKQAGNGDHENVGGCAFSLLMADIENHCLMTMVDKMRECDSLVLIFDGFMVPASFVDEMYPSREELLRHLEAVVHDVTGFRINLLVKPMDEYFEDIQCDLPSCGSWDTTRGDKSRLGHGIRKLSGTHQDLEDRALTLIGQIGELDAQLARKKKSGDDDEGGDETDDEEEQCEKKRTIEEELWAIFNELFVIAGDELLMVVTNKRGVVTKYDTVKLNQMNLVPMTKCLKIWMSRRETPRYRRSINSFGGINVARDVFNTYCGLPIEQQYNITDLNFDDKRLRPMLDHIFLMIGKSEELMDLFLNDLADICQNPHKRYPRAWVIQGPQGCGKSGAMDIIMRPIYGVDDPDENEGHGSRGLYASFPNALQVLREKFNDLTYYRKVIILDDETGKGDLYNKRGVFKNTLTAQFRTQESKNKDQKMAKECAQFFILTNDRGCVDLEDIRQRRYIVLEMDPSACGNEAYFRGLFALGEDPKFRINWFKYLMARDLTQHNRYKPTLPKTVMMLMELQDNMPAGPKYLWDRFLKELTHEPFRHCCDQQCKGNTDKPPHRHLPDKPCPNTRVAESWGLSWDESTKVPRIAVVADYEFWLAGQRSSSRSFMKQDDQWARQFEHALKKHNLVLNKPAGGKSDFTTTVHGVKAREEKETVTEEEGGVGGQTRIGGGGGGGHLGVKRSNKTATSRTKTTIKPFGDWSELKTAYEFPPLRTIWARMVEQGWIMPDQAMPVDGSQDLDG